MAVLEIDEIHKIIKSGEPAFISLAKKEAKKLNVLINGVGVTKYLDKIEGYENEAQLKLRKKFAGTVKHVFSNLLRPVDKVFSAKGGSRIYGTGKSQSAEKTLRVQLSDVSDGLNIKQYIENIQADKYYADPSGVVFFEWKDRDTFPTQKSILEIRNYSSSGRSVNWIMFEPEIRKDSSGRQLRGEFIRFVDGSKDYMFHKDGEVLTLVEDEAFENPWGRCPAIVNSDILNFTLKYHDSPLDKVVDLSDKYLRGQSTRNIYEQVLMYPVFWMYQQKCESCKGKGEINGQTCKTCNGTKGSQKKDVTDTIVLNTPKNSDSPIITPNVAGFSQVELTPFQESREELKWVSDVMSFTMWGSTHDTAENSTATAAFLDVQPVQERQGKFTNAFEDMEKMMTDFIGEFYLQSSYNPDGTSINWGRRYLMETPDKVLDKYIDAKEKQAPKVTLDHLLNQYYQSEFMNDIQTLSIMIKGMKVEPFVHKSDEEVQGLNVDDRDYVNKVYFNEWWATLDMQEVLTTNDENLRKKLNSFTQDKSSNNEQES